MSFDNSSLIFAGGVTAVLGPSSAGKSILMKALTGRLSTIHCTGEVGNSPPPPPPQPFLPQAKHVIMLYIQLHKNKEQVSIPLEPGDKSYQLHICRRTVENPVYRQYFAETILFFVAPGCDVHVV